MNTSFQFLDKSLQLYRYPKRFAHPSWQAWDSADELLLTHISETDNHYFDAKILILNDDFGALTCWLSPANITHVSDSLVAQTACQKNLTANQLEDANVHFLDSMSSLPKAPDWLVIKIPKSLALLEYQLAQVQIIVGENTKIVAAAKAKSVQKSTLSLFEKYLGPTHTSLAKKKSRLVFSKPTLPIAVKPSPEPISWQSDDKQLTLINYANVFARQQMDIGARLLAENLPNCDGKRVVDLGCGNGIIGLTVLQNYTDCHVTFVDESYMAVASARKNIETNFSDKMSQCTFAVSNCLEHFDKQTSFDNIICNPPFHQQNTVTDHIATQMFEDSKMKLAKGGELRVIGNRHLDYPQKLKRLFGGYNVIASDRKFSVLSSNK